MASRHFSLRMSEIGDLIDLLWAFEKQNKVGLGCYLSTVVTKGNVDLGIRMDAFDIMSDPTERAPLASVRVTCSDMNLVMVRDAVTRALYALDMQLALNEFGPAPKNQA